jgi:murein DD-endopeptidase MepM/ murein hydrolase activator NlpD
VKRLALLPVLALSGALAMAQPLAPTLAWPLFDTGGRQWISSGYGIRTAPLGGKAGGFHPGLDLACRVGTPVLAVGDGVVSVCAFDDPVYGRYMVIRLDSGQDALYGHLSETWIRRGERVTRGQIIGRSGNTGASTGPHLHFSLMVDPLAMLMQESRDAH